MSQRHPNQEDREVTLLVPKSGKPSAFCMEATVPDVQAAIQELGWETDKVAAWLRKKGYRVFVQSSAAREAN